VRRFVKASANPVAGFVSCRISEIRALGRIPSSLLEKARACAGVLAVAAANGALGKDDKPSRNPSSTASRLHSG
jgi:hypothetical protein